MRPSTIIVSAALAVLFAAPVEAQVNCGKLSYTACSGPPAHENPATGNTLGNPVHSNCKLCPGDNGIYDCHSTCGATFAHSPLSASLYMSVLAAAEERDVSTVLALADFVPEFLRFNAGRRSIQVLSCSGDDFISSLRVRDAALLARASRLDSALEGAQTNADITTDLKSP